MVMAFVIRRRDHGGRAGGYDQPALGRMWERPCLNRRQNPAWAGAGYPRWPSLVFDGDVNRRGDRPLGGGRPSSRSHFFLWEEPRDSVPWFPGWGWLYGLLAIYAGPPPAFFEVTGVTLGDDEWWRLEEDFKSDPFVQAVLEIMEATIVTGSIRPVAVVDLEADGDA